MQELYIGLMSGTSVDGIDAALVDFSESAPKLIEFHEHTIPEPLRESALQLTQPQNNEIHQLYELDNRLGLLFADAALVLLKKANISADKIRAIGSHGQTIRHQPNDQYPYTIQIGDPNIIAARTNITTIADFRRRDMANGGQGAPFAPVFHAHVLTDKKENRAIVNIGGIANITVLAHGAPQALLGFDTGPGNGLIDSWAQLHLQKPYDKNGEWAAQGKVDEKLLGKLLTHPFFQLPAPKSTGRDHFNLQWLEKQLHNKIDPINIQSTLTELTATSITDAIKKLPIPIDRIILCGGGVHNAYLVKRIQALNKNIPVNISDEYGLSADWLESMLFAWLAQQTMQQKAIDLKAVTGAAKSAILGGIYRK